MSERNSDYEPLGPAHLPGAFLIYKRLGRIDANRLASRISALLLERRAESIFA